MDKENTTILANTTVINMNPTSELSPLVNVNNEEDFSFHKLRGNLVQFEKKQRDHFHNHNTHLKDVVNVMTDKNDKTISTMTSQEHLHPSKRNFVKTPNKNQTIDHLKAQEPVNNVVSPVPAKDEDFAFEKLRKRALKLEGKNPITLGKNNKHLSSKKGEDDLEDFSFQKLKQKALDIEKHGVETPNRNKSKHVQSIQPANTHTPFRTPAKRSMPTTPQTTMSYKNHSSSTARISAPCAVKTPLAVHGPPALVRTTPQPSSTKPNSSSGSTFNPHRYKFGPTVKKKRWKRRTIAWHRCRNYLNG
jgi:hypothetical protein